MSHGLDARWRPLAWNLAGQGGSAILGLALIKLSVATFQVSAYGAASLLLGLQALVRNATLNPLLNLAIYSSQEDGKRHGIGWLQAVTARTLISLILLAFPLFLLTVWLLRIPVHGLVAASAWLVILLAAEALKTARLNLLHCDGRAGRYAIWTLADATSKPAVLLVYLASGQIRSAVALLACHAVGSTFILGLTAFDPSIRRLSCEQTPEAPSTPSPWGWMIAHRMFLLPLAGVGLTGWVTGLSDRYLVNLFLGSGQAGLYAGFYALFSAPFLILGTAFTLAIRPRLLSLHGSGQWEARNQWFRQGLILLALGVLGLAFTLFAARILLVRLLLSPVYLEGMSCAAGIILGNAILTLGSGIEQQFYVTKQTQLVLAKQIVGSFVAVIVVFIVTPKWGISGVGWACPIYAIIEFLAGIILYNLRARSGRDSLQYPQKH